MVRVTVKSGWTADLESPADLWALIREEMGDRIADLVEGTIILSGEELEDWWDSGCPIED